MEEEQLKQLIQSIRQGDPDATEKFLSLNESYLISIAKPYLNQGLSMNELIEVGRKDLIEIFKTLSDDKLIRFGAWHIKQAMLKVIDKK